MIHETYWSRRRLVINLPKYKTLSQRLVPLLSFSSLFLVVLAIFTTIVLIHKNLAPIETSEKMLAEVPANTPYLLESRIHALSAIVKPIDKISYEIVFSNAQRFAIPEQRNEFQEMLKARASQLVETAVLTLSETPGASRVQLWPDKSISPDQLDDLIGELTAAGFDDFDIAVLEQEPTL